MNNRLRQFYVRRGRRRLAPARYRSHGLLVYLGVKEPRFDVAASIRDYERWTQACRHIAARRAVALQQCQRWLKPPEYVPPPIPEQRDPNEFYRVMGSVLDDWEAMFREQGITADSPSWFDTYLTDAPQDTN